MAPLIDQCDLVRALRVQAQLHKHPQGTVTVEEHFDVNSTTGKRSETWRREEMLGGGSFGVVYLERCSDGRSQGQLRAMKVIKKPAIPASGKSESFDAGKELQALALFSQPKYREFFVTTTAWFDNDSSVMIAMDYHDKGDLSDYINSGLSEQGSRRIVKQVLQGIEFMHSFNITHRDLKPQNLLVVAPAPRWWVKIADFGISKRVMEHNSSLRTHAGTPAFMAPEVVGVLDDDLDDDSDDESSRQSYTNVVDVWAVGVICLLLLTGELPFAELKKLTRYARGKLDLPVAQFEERKVGQSGLAFTRKLLCVRPDERPSASLALQHEWIKQQPERTIDYTTAVSDPESVASASWNTTNTDGNHPTVVSSATKRRDVPPLPAKPFWANTVVAKASGGVPSPSASVRKTDRSYNTVPASNLKDRGVPPLPEKPFRANTTATTVLNSKTSRNSDDRISDSVYSSSNMSTIGRHDAPPQVPARPSRTSKFIAAAPEMVANRNDNTGSTDSGYATDDKTAFRWRRISPLSADPSRASRVPYSTTSSYIARPHLSSRLVQELRPSGGRKSHRIITVTGLSGTGKTQLVLHYLEEHEKAYHTVLWLDAKSETTTRASYERCARALKLPIKNYARHAQMEDDPHVEAVLTWLHEATQPWLVIVDNVNDIDAPSWDVRSIVPRGEMGSVVIISQDHQASRLLGGQGSGAVRWVRVDAMEPSEATQLLSALVHVRSGEQGVDTQAAMEQLVSLLDRIPLAIELVGFPIQEDIERGENPLAAFRRYAAYLRNRLNEPVGGKDPRLDLVWDSIPKAWDASFAALRRFEASQTAISPLSLLLFLSHFDPGNVQDELFRLASGEWKRAMRHVAISPPEWLSKMMRPKPDGKWDDTSYRDTVDVLQRYGFLRPVTGSWTGMTMHSLVRWRTGQERAARESWFWYATTVAACCGPVLNYDKTASPFGPHLLMHLPDSPRLFEENSDVPKGRMLWLWRRVGKMWLEAQRLQEAEQFLSASLQQELLERGEKDPDTLSTMGSLLITYMRQRKDDLAEQLGEQLVRSRQEVYGEKHTQTLSSMANLALIYGHKDKLNEAEKLGDRVLRLRQELLGEKHTDTMKSLGFVALTYKKQRRLDEAAELEERALRLLQETLGPNHHDTVRTMHNLGVTYYRQERFDKAVEIAEQVLSIRQEVLGEKHPTTIEDMRTLAGRYREVARFKEAEEMLERAVQLSQ